MANEVTPEAKLSLAIKKLRGVKETHRAEICGLWLWVEFPGGKPSDETRELLRTGDIKFRWAPRKKKWYFPAVPGKGRGASMSYIRKKYGSEELEAV